MDPFTIATCVFSLLSIISTCIAVYMDKLKQYKKYKKIKFNELKLLDYEL